MIDKDYSRFWFSVGRSRTSSRSRVSIELPSRRDEFTSTAMTKREGARLIAKGATAQTFRSENSCLQMRGTSRA